LLPELTLLSPSLFDTAPTDGTCPQFLHGISSLSFQVSLWPWRCGRRRSLGRNRFVFVFGASRALVAELFFLPTFLSPSLPALLVLRLHVHRNSSLCCSLLREAGCPRSSRDLVRLPPFFSSSIRVSLIPVDLSSQICHRGLHYWYSRNSLVPSRTRNCLHNVSDRRREEERRDVR